MSPLVPKRYFTLASPKKYHPTMVEKAKKSRHTATKGLPKFPMPTVKAAWVRAMPVVFPSSTPVQRITRAVMFSTTKVSMNTPTMPIRPCSAGIRTLATAWAWGVEPIPASLEKRPRAMPYRMAWRMVAPMMPPVAAAGLKAPTKMALNAGRIWPAWNTRITRPPTR